LLKEGKKVIIMGDFLVAGTNSTIVEFSSRAIFGAVAALFVLFLLNSLFKNSEVKKYLFILVIAVILLATTVLFVSALATVRELAV
jgi:hypothetical protein